MSHAVEHRGCHLSYAVEGAGTPVVMIQGVGVHGAAWRPQLNRLARDHRCLTFDNRGIGKSQPFHPPLTVEHMGDDTARVMDAAGFRSAHIVGHSLGGLVAIDVALSCPERVRSLSLLCTFARGRDAGRSAKMMWLGLRSRVGTRRMRREAFLRIVMPPEALRDADTEAMADELGQLFGHDLADHPGIELTQLRAMSAYDAVARLPRLAKIPTLVVSAYHDPIAPPRLGRQISENIPGSRYIELADAAHGAPIQFADRINAWLAEHMTRAEMELT